MVSVETAALRIDLNFENSSNCCDEDDDDDVAVDEGALWSRNDMADVKISTKEVIFFIEISKWSREFRLEKLCDVLKLFKYILFFQPF